MVGRPPPAPCAYDGGGPPSGGGPNSPLSRLVQDGYSAAGVPARSRSERGFNAGVAQQWTENVQQSRANHQQQNDPNYVQKSYKSSGYRVSQMPGGGSSLSLAWDEAGGGGDPARRGRGAGMAPPSPHSVGGSAIGGAMAGCLGGGPSSYQSNATGAGGRNSYRSQSPSAFGAGVAGVRASSREPGGMGGCLGGGGPGSYQPSYGARAASPGGMAASMAGAAYDSRAAPSYGGAPCGGGVGGGNYAAPPPTYGGAKYSGSRQTESTSLAFGNRVDGGSSNSYACGANQNVGNGISDRRTTKVLQAPGGASQISFG